MIERHCCDKCNTILDGDNSYKLKYGAATYTVCPECMKEVIKKELFVLGEKEI